VANEQTDQKPRVRPVYQALGLLAMTFRVLNNYPEIPRFQIVEKTKPFLAKRRSYLEAQNLVKGLNNLFRLLPNPYAAVGRRGLLVILVLVPGG
jgi:hypothetical protein